MKLRSIFSALLALACLAPALVHAIPQDKEYFYPDRTRMAFSEWERGKNPVPLFRVRAGSKLRVIRHNSRDSHVFVTDVGGGGKAGWVRYSPAEMISHPGFDQSKGLISKSAYSVGWHKLYSFVAKFQGEELKEKLRKLNRNQWTLGYDRARDYMFSELDNQGGMVRCVYSGMPFPAGKRPGEGPDGTMMNAEHSWPQSFFHEKEPMRSDLHHIFPTESRINGTRSSKPFKDLRGRGEAWGPLGARSSEDGFEPPAKHKGNVARAMLYFAVQHKQKLNNAYEATLRRWHHEDPVDEAERERNNGIYRAQNGRNFFVDHPEYVDRIRDF